MTASTTHPAGHSAPPRRRRLTGAERRRQRAESLLLPKPGEGLGLREPNRVRPRLAVYVRRSMVTDTSASIARQRKALEAWVAAMSGIYDPVVDFYFDEVSAKGHRYREDVERLLREVKKGRYDGVVVWELARFMRSKRENRIACGILHDNACELYIHQHRGISLWGPTALVIELLADQAQAESESTAARVKDWHQFMASIGAHPGRAPLGMRKVEVQVPVEGRAATTIPRLEPDDAPAEHLRGVAPAAFVRAAAAAVIAGRSVRSLVVGWNEAGLLTANGLPWSCNAVEKLLRNPTLAGCVVHRGKPLGLDGKPARPGQELARPHVPLFDPKKWAQLQKALAGRSKPRGDRRSNESLLRGLLTCARCEGPLVSGGDRYRCITSVNQGATVCPGNSIAASRTEQLVVAAVVHALADPARWAQAEADNAPAPAAAAEQEAEVEMLQGALEQLELDQLRGRYRDADGERRFEANRATLTAELETALAALAAHRPAPTLRPVTDALLEGRSGVEAVGAAFSALPRHEQTTLLCEVLERVTVGASRGQGGPFDPTRLSLVWNQD